MGLFNKKSIKKEFQKFWDCKDCQNKSRKLKNLRHEIGCPANRIELTNQIPRMFYFGHHLIASIDGYDEGQALWKCYSCCQIWFAWDGETCPYCNSIHRPHGLNPIYANKSPDFNTYCDYDKIQHLFPKKSFIRRQNLDEEGNYISDFDLGHVMDAYASVSRGEYQCWQDAFEAKNQAKRRSLAIDAAKKWLDKIEGTEEHTVLLQDSQYLKCNNRLSAYDEKIYSKFLPQFANFVWLKPSMMNRMHQRRKSRK